MGNRMIKESIRTSKTVNAMTDFQFRVWVYLITYVDDYGRGSADPELIKGLVFPRRKRLSESDIEKALAELAGMGCISLYDVDGESYFYFPNWGEHQRIQSKKSKYPSPENGVPRNSTVTNGESPPETKPNRNQAETEIETEDELLPPVGGRDAPARAKTTFPTLEQVREVAKLRDCPECAKPFFDYYSAAGWRDSEGKPCAWNWQQKLVAWQQRQERMEKQRRSGEKASGNVFLDMLREEEGHGQG